MGTVPSEFDGVDVTFDVRGTGDPTLVFVHGLAGDRSDFEAQLTYFETAHRVVAVGLPSSGRSEWTMSAFGADVASVADHLAIDDMVLVGHSLGGDVTVEAARRLGERVCALVWISSYRSLGAPQSDSDIERWLAPFHDDFVAATDDLASRNFGPNADPDLVARIAATMCAADPGIVRSVLSAKMFNEPALLRALSDINVPVIAINPDFKPNDRASFEAHGVELVELPGVGHFTMLEDPDGVNDALADIVARVSPCE